MKYVIDVPEEIAKISEEFLSKAGLLCEPYTEPDREAIENEVWSFVNFLENKLKVVDYESIFNTDCPYDKYTYQEAQSKFEAWVKQRDEIKIGEEIVGIYSDGEKSPPLVVFRVEGNYYYGIYSKTGEFVQGGLNYEKTGRYFPEVAQLLEKIKNMDIYAR